MRKTAAVVLSTLSLVAACGDVLSPTLPMATLSGASTANAVVPDPLDPNILTYTFDDIPANCAFGDVIPDPYEGLDFSTNKWTGCFAPAPNNTVAIVPADQAKYDAGNAPSETRIQLPRIATAVSIEYYDLWNEPVTLNAYGTGGVLLATMTATTVDVWTTLAVAAPGIRSIGIVSLQAATYFDNLRITYVGTGPGSGNNPTSQDQCKKGGWELYGFKNQGQCVKFVETGKDGRVS